MIDGSSFEQKLQKLADCSPLPFESMQNFEKIKSGLGQRERLNTDESQTINIYQQNRIQRPQAIKYVTPISLDWNFLKQPAVRKMFHDQQINGINSER